MTSEESKFYDLGRQAHEQGHPLDACNVLSMYRCWWKAGHHDADIESGNRIYHGPERGRLVSDEKV